MKIFILLNILLIILGVMGIVIFLYLKPKSTIKIKRNRYRKFKYSIEKKFSNNKEINNIFEKYNLKFSVMQYQIFRYLVFILFCLFATLKFLIYGGNSIEKYLLIIILIFILSTPKIEFMGKKTPFALILDIVLRNIKAQRNLEIYRVISQLKNICIAKQSNPPSAIFILNMLSGFTDKIKPTFNDMIYLFNENKQEEGCNLFAKNIGTTESEELAKIFLKLDEIKPNELKSQLLLYEDNIRKKRESSKLKSIESRSYLVYVLVILSSSVVLINFIIVAYFIDSQELLKFLY